VIRVMDLASAQVRDPLVVRAAVEAAEDLDELAAACRLLPSTAVELFEIGVPPPRVAGLLSAVLEAVLRRVLRLEERMAGLGVTVSWMVLGSLARREVLPCSDIDTAVVWGNGPPSAVTGSPGIPGAHRSATAGTVLATRVRAAASGVLGDLERVGLRRCPDGANADSPLFGRSLESWAESTRAWIRDASADGALLLSTMLADSRAVTELSLGRQVTDGMLATGLTPGFLRALLSFRVAVRPPTGFVRDFVVEHSGEHRGELSLKRGGLRPLTSLGRWVAVVTGDSRGTTPQRLRRGAEAGLLTEDEAATLVGAFEQVFGLLFEAEVEAVRAGLPASDYVSPAELDSLTRRHLRESFRAIAHVQSRLESLWVERTTP
jgi:CBS domain-containing protein